MSLHQNAPFHRGSLLERLPPVFVFVAAGLLALHGPIMQPAHYHAFADQRLLWGIPHGADVLSNAGFILVGLWGLVALWFHRRDAALAPGWPGYALFLVALVLTGLGSSFYHLSPDDFRLQWDRLPIALACAGLLVAVRAETHLGSDSIAWLILLAAAAILSVAWWAATDAYGVGDLRPYLLLQAAPLVLIPLWQGIHGAPAKDRRAFGLAILLYIAAKLAEIHDHDLLDLLGEMVSGHTIKHLLATLAAAVLVRRLIQRMGSNQARPSVWTWSGL